VHLVKSLAVRLTLCSFTVSLCHCVTLLCYAPDVEQIKMMMMMMMKISNKIARISSSLAILSEILI